MDLKVGAALASERGKPSGPNEHPVRRGAAPTRPRRMHATEGLGLGLRSGASPKVADSTAFDLTLTLTLTQEEEIFGLSFEEVLAQEKGAGLDLRGSGGMAASLR